MILGIEFGSTRIKAVLTDERGTVIASGSNEWENSLVDGVWTYGLDEVTQGLATCYADLVRNYGQPIERLDAMGVSAMMHGYLVFDGYMRQLVSFRTWRNTMTGEAAQSLTEAFNYPIPQRWSIAHLCQAMMNSEPHVRDIAFITTLAGYVHYLLTGERALGVGDASGMFPIDPATCDYDQSMIDIFESKYASGYPWRMREIFPKVLAAGQQAGTLTEEGARLLDPSGTLRPGCPLAPPEGDAGTGMVATDSVRPRTGNISAGTSIFDMVVLERPLSRPHSEIDIVTTPTGEPVAMVHCNNCTSDLNAWVGLIGEAIAEFGCEVDRDTLYGTLYRKALQGAADGAGLLAYNYYGGEPVTHIDTGRPLFVRLPGEKLKLADFMRVHLYAALATLAVGMEILEDEGVAVDSMVGAGGLYRTPVVGQRFSAAALNCPVSVMETAGEGGPWGMALLAGYMLAKLAGSGQTLADYLDEQVFAGCKVETIAPDPADAAGFRQFLARYKRGLSIEAEAGRAL